MSLSAIEKMRLQKDLKAVKAALSAATKPMEKVKLQKERKAIWSKLKAKAEPVAEPEQQINHPEPQGEDPILAQYRAGSFNSENAEKFRQVIHKVYEAGLPINEVAEGVVGWFVANNEKLAA